MYIYRVLRFLRLSDFPPLEFVHITAPIRATFLRQRQASIKSAEPSTGTSKRSRGENFTIAPTIGTIPAAEGTFVDLTAAVDPFGGANDVNPIVAPPLSLCALM